ncbi:threonine/serine exporter family protein [Pectinatus brassicae]|uniref:Uncharacterized membrane protein YjjP (DUF1212 family) n=1 Tax=Pectinatus brassicae TaxID=862415 RepID=A0A840UIZ2_9FIRM|nr:threonine/serine exporter family protein [Pectinatus brassicae]MBB5336949.1 uncharacterized membrane protein YjjP (DUF1212 family) [Pectinatus brassicae]
MLSTTPCNENSYSDIGRKLFLILKTGQILMESAADSTRITRTMKRVAAFMMIPEKKTAYTYNLYNNND